VADCDQPDKEHNAPKDDKRFLTHHAWEVTVDDWTHSYAISNLCHFWNLMSFMVCPSPEDAADVCVCFIAKDYREHLFDLKPELAEQIMEYNHQHR
jgi:hypothetical protein